ncbi:titin homolog [Ptychodera flava]|uniref:titin homolog n=1 Tax=Ptychodera flava TaxID=63121 RepID=UPI00396A931D
MMVKEEYEMQNSQTWQTVIMAMDENPGMQTTTLTQPESIDVEITRETQISNQTLEETMVNVEPERKESQKTISTHSTGKEGISACVELTQPRSEVVSKSGKFKMSEKEQSSKDSVAVHIGLDDTVYDKRLSELQAMSTHQRQEQMDEEMNELKDAWKDCKQALTNWIGELIADKDRYQGLKKVCKKNLGDVVTLSLTAKALTILLKLLTLHNMYRLKQTCRCGSLAKALEPLLITDEMRMISAKVGITLQLKAMYDQKKLEEIELFFIKRDCGGIQPMRIYDVLTEDTVDEIQVRFEVSKIMILYHQATNKDPVKLLLIGLHHDHNIKSSTVRTLFKAETCIRLKGKQFDIFKVMVTMTERVQHILSSRHEVLGLLGISRYLLTDAISQDHDTQELEDQLFTDGQLLSQPATDENVSLVARSLLPYQISDIKISEYKADRLLALISEKYSDIDIQKSVVQNQLAKSRQEKAIVEKKIIELTEKLDRTKETSIRQRVGIDSLRKKYSSELEQKNEVINDLHAKRLDFEQTQTELRRQVLEDIKTGIYSKDRGDIKVIKFQQDSEGGRKTMTKPSQPETADRDGSEMRKGKPTQPEMTIRDRSEMETATPTQPEMTGREGSEMETATPTQPKMTGRYGRGVETASQTQHEVSAKDRREVETATSAKPEMTTSDKRKMEPAISTQAEMTDSDGIERETATPTQPKMNVSDGSEMETATSTQPEMTGREGSEMETATPTQPKMTVSDGSEIEIATSTQPEMTGREGSEMETATSTQPEMTGREGSEMDTATPTQPEMTDRDGIEMATATQKQLGMTGRDGNASATAISTQPEMTARDRTEIETASPTHRDGKVKEASTSTQPEMTCREGSQMEAATSTQPEMTAREGSELETATPTQGDISCNKGSDIDTVTPRQPEMNGREGIEMQAVSVAESEMIRKEIWRKESPTTFLREKRIVEKEELNNAETENVRVNEDSEGVLSKIFKRLPCRKYRSFACTVMPRGKDGHSDLVTTGREELSSGSVFADEVTACVVIPGSVEGQSGSDSDDSEMTTDSESFDEMPGGIVTLNTACSSKYWSKIVLEGIQEEQDQFQFQNVCGLAFHNDQLFVCDRNNNIVHILNPDYSCDKVLGSFSGQFTKPFRPVSIAVSQDNFYFILDDKNLQVVVCNQDDKIIRLINLPEDTKPWCIALVREFVLVTEVIGHRILKYTQGGQFVAEVGGQGHGKTKFNFPYFIAASSRDVISVSDYWNHCIKCFDTDFNYLYQYGQYGGGDGWLGNAHSIAVDGNDNVYVCDEGNDRIAKWSSDGKWICNLFQYEVRWPLYIAVTPAGDRIAVSGQHGDKIVVFSQ